MTTSTKIKLSASGERLPDDATDFAATLNTETNRITAPASLHPKQMDHAAAVKAIAELNAANYAGISTWRLGKRWEHIADTDPQFSNPIVDPAFYPGTPSDYVWTEESVPKAWSADLVFVVNFYGGSVNDYRRYDEAFVRPVCSVPSSGQ